MPINTNINIGIQQVSCEVHQKYNTYVRTIYWQLTARWKGVVEQLAVPNALPSLIESRSYNVQINT